MRRVWTPEDVIASWTLVHADWALVGNKTGATRLGFVALLKFFELEGRFPRHLGEVPKAAVNYLAQQVAVPTEQIAGYDWSGRQVKRHRAQIRSAMGFREPVRRGDRAAGGAGRHGARGRRRWWPQAARRAQGRPGAAGPGDAADEIAKLGRVQAVGLPEDLFAGVSEKLVTAWRTRAATQYPSDLQAMAQPVRLTLLAALCRQRAAEIRTGWSTS